MKVHMIISPDSTRLIEEEKLDTVMDLVEVPQPPPEPPDRPLLELLILAPSMLVPFESRPGIFVRDSTTMAIYKIHALYNR